MINMDSEKKQEPQPSGMSGWLIAVIVISIAAVVGTLIYFFVYKKRANTSFKNVGVPNAGVAAPPAVPSMNNVTGGNMGATGGNARPSVNAAR